MKLIILLILCCQAAQIRVLNRCRESVWLGVLTSSGDRPLPFQPQLLCNQSVDLQVSPNWSGRIWPRTGCHSFAIRNLWCETGDCDGRVNCSVSGKPPVTLAEFTFTSELVFYDLRSERSGVSAFDLTHRSFGSLVDGYNLPLRITPSNSSCFSVGCLEDVNLNCPSELRVQTDSHETIGCKNACLLLNDDLHCCRGQFNSAAKCNPSLWPRDFAAPFRHSCPRAYTFAFEDAEATFTCAAATDFEIEFC